MKFKILFLLIFVTGFFACTDLEENLNEDLTTAQAREFLNANTDINALLFSSYEGMRVPYAGWGGRNWALSQHTSDETIGPTRGPDWDDNGAWRSLHNHTWGTDQVDIVNAFNDLLQVVFSTTNLLSFDVASDQQKAEAKFLRAFVMFTVADNWNQVPFREPGDNLLNPSNVLKGAEALDFIISECNSIINNLPDGPANRANKDAAKVLLMKCYLNKGAFADRQSPKFENSDMQQVITIADQIISSGKYSIDDNYFDNFAPNNDDVSSENIYTLENRAGNSNFDCFQYFWYSGLHYNQTPSGWNGFATLSDFYDSFEQNDVRRYTEYPGIFEKGHIANGFLVGQQYNAAGEPLKDRKGNNLAFTREVKLKETGNDLEITGIRVMKYPIDYNNGAYPDNDLVFFRYADVMLMKAEAQHRTGNAAGALAIVNDIRTARNASTLGSIDLDGLLAERGRELYWEGWRRQDLIRFGKYLRAYQEKPASGPERLLFPIPAAQLAVNPNLEQNPGY
jgi:hypothetical protein